MVYTLPVTECVAHRLELRVDDLPPCIPFHEDLHGLVLRRLVRPVNCRTPQMTRTIVPPQKRIMMRIIHPTPVPNSHITSYS